MIFSAGATKSGGNYATTNSIDSGVWPNSGSWQFQNNDKSKVLRNDNVVISISVTQTTLSLDDTIAIIKILYKLFPKILKPKSDDICYATQNRQDAVKQLALESEFIVVIGSRNSSNSNRLKELAERCGATSVLIDSAEELDFKSLSKYKSIGITAGASAPESIVQSVVQAISLELNTVAEELGENKENIYFRLPPELR